MCGMNTYKYQQFCPLYFPKFWKSSQVPPSNTSAKSLQSCPTLCDPIDGSQPGSSIPGTLQARTPEWVAISFSNEWKWKVKGKSLSCLTLRDPVNYSLPGSSVHGICQARVMEWGAINTSTSLKKKKKAKGRWGRCCKLLLQYLFLLSHTLNISIWSSGYSHVLL